MSAVVIIIVVGLVAGVAVGLQGPLSSLISQHIGTLESVFIVHVGGAVAALVPLLLRGGGNLSSWRIVPWYALGAGVFGLVVISGISFMIPRIGAAAAFILLIAGQITVAALLDHFGLLGTEVRRIDLPRLAGLLVVLLGVWLTVRR